MKSIYSILTLFMVSLSLQAQPSFSKFFNPTIIGAGNETTLTYTINNSSSGTPVTGMAFTDNLPVGMTVSANPNISTSCFVGTVTAVPGSTTISFADGTLSGNQSCTITVNVSATASVTSTSGDLTSSAGNSGTASANLTVDPNVPVFSKAFSPATVNFGDPTRLTFTIDNTAGLVNLLGLNFSDQLPGGMVVADPANLSISCGNISVVASPGSSNIVVSATQLGLTTIPAATICTISLDVVSSGIGTLINQTSNLTVFNNLFQSLNAGIATASIEVLGPEEIFLSKSFTTNPISPGGVTSIDFTIMNFDRNFPANNISFIDDLNAFLPGVVATGLPINDACGLGSVVSGGSTISFTGGSLPAEGNCTFSVPIEVPVGTAAGIYPNTTGNITADIDGSTVTGNPAIANLTIYEVPTITKTFLTDPILAGETTTLEFTISNTSTTSALTDIGFQDNITAFLSGATVSNIPAAGFMGAGSFAFSQLIQQELTFTVQGGQLAPGASSTFSIDITVPINTNGAIFTNEIQNFTANLDGEIVSALPASDDLTVLAIPSLTKSFTDDPVLAGGTVNLEFTLSHDAMAGGDATVLAFMDDLNAVLPGLSAIGLPLNNVCGIGSSISGTTNLSFTGGSLTPGNNCTFSIPVLVPAGVSPGTFTNTTSAVTGDVSGMSFTGNTATDELAIGGLEFTKEFIDGPYLPGELATLRFTIDNTSAFDASNIVFSDNLSSILPGLVAEAPFPVLPCGAPTATGTNFFIYSGGAVNAGTSCTFDVNVRIPLTAPNGDYENITSNLTAFLNGQNLVLDPAVAVFEVNNELIQLTKTFTDDPVVPGGTVNVEYTLTNLDPANAITSIVFTEDFDGLYPGLTATGLPLNDICEIGSMISGTGLVSFSGELAAGASCTFSISLQVPASIPNGTVLSCTTSQVTGINNSFPVIGTAASDDLHITSLVFDKSMAGTAVPGESTTVTFTITNMDAVNTYSDIEFTDDLDAFISGMIVTGLPAADFCGGGSVINGTSTISVSRGVLGPGASCSFEVEVMVPCDAATGMYTNTTSNLTSISNGGVSIAPASASIQVNTPNILFPALNDVCVNGGNQTGLGAASPTGGIYSGLGVTNDIIGMTFSFNPMTAGVGIQTITYTYTDANMCVFTETSTIDVKDIPAVSLTAPGDLCIDAGIQMGIGGASPMGGFFSGDGVMDAGDGLSYSFDPSVAGVGVTNINYTYTDANNCTNTATDQQEVFALPVVAFTAPDDQCIDAGIQANLGSGTPSGVGGVYSGPGVSDGANGMTYSFDPATAGVGTHTITYMYTDGNGCMASATDMVEVFALPVVSFTAPNDLCLDAGIQAGLGSGAPSGVGGVYSGPGVSDGANGMTYSFDPAMAGVGTHTISYMYTDGNGCMASATDMVEVFALPVVSFTTLTDLCIDAGIQTGLGSGSPSGAGGIYSGSGVADDGNGMTYSFDPAAAGAGTHTLTYMYSDANGCMAFATDMVEVFALPVVSFTAPADLCVNLGVQSGLGPGSPSGVGGIYTGTGVSDDGNGLTYSFDPVMAGIGTHTITYMYTDANGCADSATDMVEVFDAPMTTFMALVDLCENAGVQTGLGSGIPDGGAYSGPGVADDGNGMTFSFDPVMAGVGIHTISYTFSNMDGCTDIATDLVEVFEVPTCLAAETVPVSCTGLSDGMASTTPSGGDGNYTFLWDNGETDALATMLNAGVHAVTVTDGNGCSSSCMVTISTVVDLTPPVFNYCQPFPFFVGLQPDGTINVATDTYYFGATDNCSAAGDIALSGMVNDFTCADVGSNVFTLTITDEAGVTATCDVEIVIIDAEPPALTCPGSSGNLIPNGDFDTGDFSSWSFVFGNTFIEPFQGFPTTPTSKLFGNFNAPFNASGFGQDIPCQGGDWLCLSGNMLTPGGDDIQGSQNFVELKMEFYDAGGNILNGPFGTPVGVMDGSQPVWTWGRYSGCLQAPPGTSLVKAVVVFVQPNFEGGSVFVDNLNLEKLTPTIYDVNMMDCTANITIVPPVPTDACGIVDFTDSYNNTGDASGNYPMGQTLVTYTTIDGNSLISECSIVVEVVDSQEPTFAPLPVSECSMVGLSIDLNDFITNGVTGATYSWIATDNPNVTGESTTAMTGNLIADLIINTSGMVQTVTYVVSPDSSNGCDYESFEVTVDIYAEITADFSCSCGLNAAGTQIVPIVVISNIDGGSPQANNSNYTLTSTDGTLSMSTAAVGDIINLELTNLEGGPYVVTIVDDEGCESILSGECIDCSFVPEFVLVDPCSCNNDQSANGAMDGTFGETVQILGPSGFILTVGAGSTGMIGADIGDVIGESSPGVYEISFDHLDNVGYTITVDIFTAGAGTIALLDINGNPLSNTNACQYPILSDPVLAQIDFCVTDDGISLAGATMEIQGHPGTLTTLVNGFETETFDPASVGTGQHIVQYNFNGDLVDNSGGTMADPAVPGCFTYVTQRINVHSGGQLACNDHVTISVNEDCSLSVITVDAFLEGAAQDQFYGFQILGVNDLPIELNNANDPNYISNYIGETLTYEVYDECSGNSCWGTVTLEDKIAPEVDCDCQTPYLGDGVTPNPDCVFYCYEVWDLEILEDKQKNNNELLPDADDSAPTDNCLEFGEPRLISYEYLDGNCGEQIVQRKMIWDYINADGNVESIECIQNYLFDNLTTNNIGMTGSGTWDGYDNIFAANSGDRPMSDFYTPEPVVILPCGTDSDPASIADYYDVDTPGRPVGKDRDDHDDTPNIIEHNEGYPYAFPYVVIKGWSNRYHAKPIDNNVCNIYQSYTDLEYDACADECKGTRKIGRTWTILDWCTSTVLEFQQTIKVIDIEAPTISGNDQTVSVDPWSCSVDYEVPYPEHLHDNCDSDLSWSVTGPAGVTFEGNTALGLPKGVTVLEYVAVDCCGNVSRSPFSITVVDNTAPTVIVKQNLVVQLTNIEDNSGLAKLYAVDVDNFSHDGCSDIHFEIRRSDDGGCDINSATFNNDEHPDDYEFDTDGGAFVKFCCADIDQLDSLSGISFGVVDVILRVWDDGDMDGSFGSAGDNYNESWATVRVEDKLDPVVICPPTQELACHEDYLNYDLTGRPYASKTCTDFACDEEPSDRFKKKPANSAPFLGEEIAAYNPSCRRGAIERTWNCGEYECTQWIIMRDTEEGPLDVTFPDDQTVNCIDTDPGTPIVVERLCELSGVSLESDTFNFEDGACYKILNHWTVINWCDYDANDSDLNENIDQEDDGIVPGYYQHTQVIKLIDTEKPVLTVLDTCFAANTECVGTDLEIWAGATDNGVCGSAWLKWEVEVDLWSDWEVDYTYSSFIGAEEDYYIAPNSGDLHISLPDDLPMGCASSHRILWTVHDGCGNSTSRTSFFTVEDKKKPTPYMLNLSTALMQNGQVELWARDFDAGSFDNCTDQDYLAYTFSSTVPPQLLDPLEEDPWYDVDGVAKESDYENGEAEEWNGATLSSARIFDLDDLALAESNGGFLPLEVHVWDLCGNEDYAVVNLKLILNEDDLERVNITGNIASESGVGIEDVRVTALSDQAGYPYTVTTDSNGNYMFEYNPIDADYTLKCEKRDDWLNGVTTLDLVLIQRHILGLESLEGAYNLIAADANNDEKVTAIDLIHLRKLILGVYEELPSNDSWRFLDSQLSMNVDNPWPFSDLITIDALSTEMNENFLGLKVGDVNGSAILSLTNNELESRSNETLQLNIKQIDLGQGETKLELRSNNFTQIAGFQFTLEAMATEIIEVIPGAVDLEDTQVSLKNGALVFSWNADRGLTLEDELLFSVTFKSSDLQLRLSDRIARSEAYQGEQLDIIEIQMIGDGDKVNKLFQNDPNPWRGETSIQFSLSTATKATLRVTDVSGKILMTSTNDYTAGDHVYLLSEQDLIGAAGVLYYTLETEDFITTKKMVRVK